MTVTESSVYLRDRVSGQLVSASLYDQILERHLQDFEQKWKRHSGTAREEHGHWDWRKKIARVTGQLSFRSFALECSGETQGLMLVDTMKRCRLPQQANKHLVYVDFLEAAPWNRGSVTSSPRYRGVGSVLVAAAIQLSMEEGNHGRIGLHSLPQAETLYQQVCKMTGLGPDTSYPKYPLRYFEMTESQAKSFLQHGR